MMCCSTPSLTAHLNSIAGFPAAGFFLALQQEQGVVEAKEHQAYNLRQAGEQGVELIDLQGEWRQER